MTRKRLLKEKLLNMAEYPLTDVMMIRLEQELRYVEKFNMFNLFNQLFEIKQLADQENETILVDRGACLIFYIMGLSKINPVNERIAPELVFPVYTPRVNFSILVSPHLFRLLCSKQDKGIAVEESVEGMCYRDPITVFFFGEELKYKNVYRDEDNTARISFKDAHEGCSMNDMPVAITFRVIPELEVLNQVRATGAGNNERYSKDNFDVDRYLSERVLINVFFKRLGIPPVGNYKWNRSDLFNYLCDNGASGEEAYSLVRLCYRPWKQRRNPRQWTEIKAELCNKYHLTFADINYFQTGVVYPKTSVLLSNIVCRELNGYFKEFGKDAYYKMKSTLEKYDSIK